MPSKSKNLIACRPGCYDLPLVEAMAELRKTGIENIEAKLPEDGDYRRLAAAAADAGVSISSLATDVHLNNQEELAGLEHGIEGAAETGVPLIFLSANVSNLSYGEGIAILREFGHRAHSAGVILSLETHLPFAHNSDAIRRTLTEADSPGLGYNFDTANIYYYNPRGTDAVDELKKALPFVTSVHLKESARGEPEAFDFPVLGTGIVDFPGVFRLLKERGFTGPYTLELEGGLVNGLPTEERSKKVAACLGYLKEIGAMD